MTLLNRDISGFRPSIYEVSIYPGGPGAKWPLRTWVGHVVYPGTEQNFHSSVHGWAHPGTEAGVRMRCDMFRNITLLSGVF